MLLKKTNKYWAPILLVIIAFLSHRLWFYPNSVLTFSDWYWWPDAAVKNLLTDWGSWVHAYWGLGVPNVQIYFNIFMFFWSALVNLGLTYDQVVKLNLFIPIAIMGFISPYILGIKLSNNKLASFATALFYGSNIYFLTVQTAHLPIAFVNAFAPLVFYMFILALEKNNIKNWLGFTILFSIVSNYEIRITYILAFILGLYFLINHIHQFKKYLIFLIISSVVFIFLNLYWILPTFIGGISANVIDMATRGLFGNNLSTIFNAFTISTWNWTGVAPNENFEVQRIFPYFWFFPVFIFTTLLNSRINKNKRTIFFLSLALLGIFLTKQSSAPFTGVYSWLYWHFPGFGLFRESSKLYLITVLGYSNLILLNINSFRYSKKKVYYLITSSVILFSLINLWPLFTKQIDTLFVNRSLPVAFNKLNNYLNNDSEYYRVLSVPRYSKWMVFSELHPRVFAADEVENNWKSLAKFQDYPVSFSYFQKMQYFLSTDLNERLLNQSAIKYVVVPPKDSINNDNYYVYYEGNPETYTKIVSNMPGLIKINIFDPTFTVFENPDYRPHLYLTNDLETLKTDQSIIKVNYREINSSQYQVTLPYGFKSSYLNFSESYNANWRVRMGDFNWFDALTHKNYFLDSKDHQKTEAGLNSFKINPEKLVFSANDKPTFTIYYWPQSYYYLGLVISCGSLVSLIIFLFILQLKKE